MFYLIPPAGTPITFRQLFNIAGFGGGLKGEDFREKIKSLTGTSHCFLINSGRSALLIGLNALYQLNSEKRSEVIIPAYTCYSVASAVARAGLKIRIVDVNPETLDYNYDRFREIDCSRVLAIIGCNLLGIPSNWGKLKIIASMHNLYLIDDAAQSMGSIWCNEAAGTSGDIGFYSLGRGKNMTTYSGGILITDNDNIAASIENSIRNLKSRSSESKLGFMLKIWLYSIFLRPRLYWFPAMMPFLGLGGTLYDENFPVGCLSSIQNEAGVILVQDLSGNNEIRRNNAKEIINAIRDLKQFFIPAFDEDACPAYLRLPVICPNREIRNRLIRDMRKIGVIASNLYPSTIRQIPRIEQRLASTAEDFPGAQFIVNHLLTLPIHAYLRNKDIERMISCLKRAVA